MLTGIKSHYPAPPDGRSLGRRMCYEAVVYAAVGIWLAEQVSSCSMCVATEGACSVEAYIHIIGQFSG